MFLIFLETKNLAYPFHCSGVSAIMNVGMPKAETGKDRKFSDAASLRMRVCGRSG